MYINFVMEVLTFPKNLLTTSGLSILSHGVISFPDATSYDNTPYMTGTSLLIQVTEQKLQVSTPPPPPPPPPQYLPRY